MNQKGFTIIEVLFYIAISTMLILGLTAFMISITEVRERSKIVEEVEQQGAQIMELITRTIRQADAINSPTVGNSASSLSLAMPEVGENPTIFSLSGQVLQATLGANPVEVLHNNQVIVTDLNFINLSRPSTPGIIQVSFTLKYNHSSGREIYNYQKTFQASATLR